jgi:lipopolysaccharide transport system permease protein
MSTKVELVTEKSLTENTLGHESITQVSQTQLAINDIIDGLSKWQIWLLLAYHDIKVRYRRSTLGPFWITLSMAITVYSMGYLYAFLFQIDLQDYFPFLVTSMLTWTLISMVLNELTDVFVSYEGLIKELKLPYTLYIHRVISRNIIIFFHNIIVMIPVYIIFHQTAKINLCTILMIPGLLLIYVNAVIYGMILAVLGSRFRDVSQIIKNLIQVIFFITPVMWTPYILPESKRYFVNFNPFYSFLELVRAPLLGNLPTFYNLGMALLVSFIGVIICLRLFIVYRTRIIYWV